MVTALDIGQYVYQRTGWIDSWRLQKLVFFSHAWSFAWDGHGLFDSDVEAWPDGPVERELFRVNKHHRDAWSSTELPGADVSRLSDRQREIVDAVLAHYQTRSTAELVDASHTSIWESARGGEGRHAQGGTIPVEQIRRWYTRAALSGDDVPAPPQGHIAVVSEVSDEAIDGQINRWRGVLDLLADR